jgi:integrase
VTAAAPATRLSPVASVEARPGGVWRVVWREAGAKQYERFGSRAAAEEFKTRVEVDGNRWPRGWTPGVGFDAPDVSTAPTFREWAERAIASRSKANRRTRADYRRDLTNHVYPAFGDMPLDRITSEQVGGWLIRLGEKAAPKTIKNVHALASSVFADAVQGGHVTGPNPFRGAMRSLPTVRTEEMVFLSSQEVDTIAAEIGELYRPLVILLARTGLRWSEATALKVSDVELFGPRKTVTVVRAWKRDDDGTMYIGEPKSRRSRRTLPLDAATVDALIPLVASRNPGDWLFTSKTGRVVAHSTFRKDHWVPTLDRLNATGMLGKRPRIHDMRHTHASWLIAAGLPLTAVQRRLGHESIQTTSDRYGHLDSDMDDRVIAALDLISGSRAVVSADAARILDR